MGIIFKPKDTTEPIVEVDGSWFESIKNIWRKK